MADRTHAGAGDIESTLTDRYQTTVPGPVRRALRLGKRDRIRYLVEGGGRVVITRGAAPEAEDPALEAFLRFLARDIAGRPERIRALGRRSAARIRALVKGVKVDLEAPLDPGGE